MSSNCENRNIVITVDGSEHSMRAFDWYVKNLLRAADDTVYCLHVPEQMPVPVLGTEGGAGLYFPTDDWLKSIEKVVEERSKKIKELQKIYHDKMKDLKLKGEFAIEESDGTSVGNVICNFVKSKEIDIVVMGNRGLGALRRTFLGSVSDYVLHHAGVPVMVVPPHK